MKKSNKDSDTIYIWCVQIHIRFAEYYIQSSHKETMKIMADAEKSSMDEKKFMFKKLFELVNKHSDEVLNSHFEKKNKRMV